MICLQDSPYDIDPISPSGKTFSHKKRRLYKSFIRVSLLGAFFVVCFFFGRGVQWSSLSENYNSKDVDFIQYFCSQSQFAPNNPNTLKEETEHFKAGYLDMENSEPDTVIPDYIWNDLPVKGAYYMVVRNEDLADAKAVIQSMEDHMTNGTRYPWIFLNNQAFTPDFKKYIKKVTKAPVFFGKIDLNVWEYPYWIDIPRAEYLMIQQEANDVNKGVSLSYHQMLRYQAGFFFHHPLFKDVQYSWRVEPGADYSCQMDEDMFLQMKNQNKTLGFVLTMYESPETIPTLWMRVNEFIELYPEYILPEEKTIYPWIYSDLTENYNLCHFWTNFQIADLSFFRSEAYQRYFQYLDNTGNFFYERWSDAPVQTIAAALFLEREKIHFFNNIGYTHSIATHCPYDETLLSKCSCDVLSNYDLHPDSCTRQLLKLIDRKTLKDMAKFIKRKQVSVPS